MHKTILWLTVVALTAGASATAAGQEAKGPIPPPKAPPIAAPGKGSLDVLVGAKNELAPTTMGKVDTVDAQTRTLTLEGGDAFVLPANVPGAAKLMPGQRVVVTYKIDGVDKVVRGVAPVGN